MKKPSGLIVLIAALTLFAAFCGCLGSDSSTGSTDVSTTISVSYDEDDVDSSVDSSEVSYITFNGDSISFDGSGASVDGNIVTITAAGTYSISGTLNDGQIIVNAGDENKVKLILNGVDITSSINAPIYVISADKTIVTLAGGTANYVTDSDSYIDVSDTDEPNPSFSACFTL